MRLHLLGLCFLFLFSNSVWAGSVIKSSGKKVFIKFSADDSFTEGDYFHITDADGKKKGLVLIKKVKGLKAVGVLKKGKAPDGGLTVFKGAGKSAKKGDLADSDSGSSESSEDESSDGSPHRPTRWGLMLGYGSAKQDVTDPDSGEVSKQSGTSYSFKGLYDYPILESITVRGLAGMEIFSVSGPTNGGPEVGSDIKYLTVDGLMKWDFYDSKSMQYYLIGGMSVFYPMSSSSTAIDPETISSFVIGEFGAGLEIKCAGYTLPLQFTYYYFPAGKDVKTNVMAIKLGFIF